MVGGEVLWIRQAGGSQMRATPPKTPSDTLREDGRGVLRVPLPGRSPPLKARLPAPTAVICRSGGRTSNAMHHYWGRCETRTSTVFASSLARESFKRPSW